MNVIYPQNFHDTEHPLKRILLLSSQKKFTTMNKILRSYSFNILNIIYPQKFSSQSRSS